LHRGRIGVSVDGDHLEAETLSFDRDFFPKFACAEQHQSSR
jgi:hypothetical protein